MLDKDIPESLPNEADLSALELAALRNLFQVIKKHFRVHAFAIYLQFFTEHYQLLERFRDLNTGKYKLRSLNRHAEAVLRTFERLIDNLEDASYVHGVLKRWRDNHIRQKVSQDEIRLYAYAVKDHFLEVTSANNSITLEVSLGKFCDFLVDRFVQSNDSS